MTDTVVDFFAGVGGLSEGFRLAGCKIVGAIEWDQESADCYQTNHRRHGMRVPVLRKDIRLVSPQALLQEFHLEPGELTFLVGGSPCQGFSTMGKRRKDDHRNELIFQFPRFLRVLKSEAFLIENVPGILDFDGGRVLSRVMDELGKAGYHHVKYALVDAAACGVPQKRQRVVVYGSRTSKLPDFSHLASAGPDGPRVWDAIADLPEPEAAAKRYDRGSAVPYGSVPSASYAKRLRARCSVVTRWEPVAHSEDVRKAYARLEQGETEPKTKCWRLVAEGRSRTLRAGSRTRTACRPVHPFKPRVITVREAARLHSFCDSSVFPPATSAAHVSIGNAVPPLMGKVLAEAFCKTLSERGRNKSGAKKNRTQG